MPSASQSDPHVTHDLPRRDFLKLAAYLGVALVAPRVRAVHAPGLTPRELAVVGEVAELIIPTTDTSGAMAAGVPAFVDKMVSELRSLGPWFALLSGFGECLPRYENRVSLNPGKRDEWDMPLINTSFGWGENELLMAKHITADAREMLEAVGAQGIQELSNLSPGGMGIHEMGTARMGRDPKTSFLNAFNQSHEVRNLFVTDGACMASSANQNPSLTYMALTARAAHYAVEQLKQHRL